MIILRYFFSGIVRIYIRIQFLKLMQILVNPELVLSICFDLFRYLGESNISLLKLETKQTNFPL